jgi:radical SAM superfamily enzyme YgiQ (UPF0313 family)
MSSEHTQSILLISCYELGHQPAGISMPMAFLKRAGHHVEAMDVSVEGFDAERVKRARFVGISVPMHTALRLGVKVAEAIRKANPDGIICFYGLYASLNSEYLLSTVADYCIGGEFEESLVGLVARTATGGQISTASGSDGMPQLTAPTDTSAPRISTASGSDRVQPRGAARSRRVLERLSFPVPDRSALPPLDTYARLERNGEERLAGYVEASRGCLHVCAHCPIPPVYEGRFFIVPQQVVLEDIRRLVAAGAEHITFGDPDFLNGPGHSLRILREMHQEFPSLTFDFTAKVEHILKHRSLFPELAALGCAFIVSAVESLSDDVLMHLEKGHTRRDVYAALDITRDSGIPLRPTWVAFTPWTTIADYLDMLEFVQQQELIDHVDPVQYTIRLLVPPGSALLARPDTRTWLGPLVQESFTYSWSHPDPRMDELQSRAAALVERAALEKEDPADTFWKILDLACETAGKSHPATAGLRLPTLRRRPPRLTEAWFC